MAFAFGVLRGEITHHQFHPKTGELVEMEASPALKWEIAKWIKEQGFGKEIARLDVTSGGEKIQGEAEESPDLSQLTTAEVRQYLALRMKTMKRGAVVDAGPGPAAGPAPEPGPAQDPLRSRFGAGPPSPTARAEG
jgi:hypothetical protein